MWQQRLRAVSMAMPGTEAGATAVHARGMALPREGQRERSHRSVSTSQRYHMERERCHSLTDEKKVGDGKEEKTSQYLHNQWQVDNFLKLPVFTAGKSRRRRGATFSFVLE